MLSSRIFRANDIRGIYNKDFGPSFTKSLARAMLALCRQNNIKKPRFLIGRDARLSSPLLGRLLSRHLTEAGADVAFIGLAPSPLCYFLLYHYKLTACLVITASHNPLEYNGFKILFRKKYKIFHPIQKLKPLILKGLLEKSPKTKKGRRFYLKKEEPYISSLKKEFSFSSPPAFAIDAGNGALGPLAKAAFSALGLRPRCLFCRPNGRFPHHHPDPTVEKNLARLKALVQKESYEFGIGFDGDGDRLALVSKEGRMILGDELAYLFLKSGPGSRKRPALADVKCSDWLFKWAKKKGIPLIMTQSGHGLMRAKMEESKAWLALELSGHIFFNDRKGRGFDDALYASLRLIEILKKERAPLSRLLPPAGAGREGEIRIDMSEKKVEKSLYKIQSYLTKKKERFKSIDGIRVSRRAGWALFRGSKTQPALSMRFEARSKKELALLKKEFSSVINLKIP